MSLGAALRAILLAHPPVATLVAARVFPLMIPEADVEAPGTMPCVVYTLVGASRALATCEQSRKVGASVQVDCYARNPDDADLLAAAVRGALIDYRGTSAGVAIDRVSLDNEFQLVDPDPGLFRVSQAFSAWYLEER